MPQSCDMRPMALLPLRRKTRSGVFRQKNPTASAGFEPANLGTRGQRLTTRPPKPLSHVLVPRNISVLGSTKTAEHHRFSVYCIAKLLQFTIVCLYGSDLGTPRTVSRTVTWTRLLTSKVSNRPLATLTTQNRSSNPPPFILTVPNLLTI
jgi:hypothetical protein